MLQILVLLILTFNISFQTNLKYDVLFVIGGPGSGKGTISNLLSKNLNYHHISTGDLLRKQIKTKTSLGLQLQNMINQGKLVPSTIMVELIDNQIKKTGQGKYLLDGFPRSFENIKIWNKFMSHIQISNVLNLNVPQEEMIKRLLQRGKTSGRADDNLQTIHQRIQVFQNQTQSVLEYYASAGKVLNVNGIGNVEEVYARVKSAIENSKVKQHQGQNQDQEL